MGGRLDKPSHARLLGRDRLEREEASASASGPAGRRASADAPPRGGALGWAWCTGHSVEGLGGDKTLPLGGRSATARVGAGAILNSDFD
jgi:hypothetical protein